MNMINENDDHEKVVEISKTKKVEEKEIKFVLDRLRPFCSKLFNIANHTFMAVLFENDLTLEDSVTKTEFSKMIEKFLNRPVTT